MVVAVLLIDGDQVPDIAFVEVVGRLKLPPLQIAETCVNVGTVLGLTVTVSEAVVAHPVPDGVNVYVVVAVLFTSGVHVPAIELLEVAGKVKVFPLQIGAMGLNVGVVDATPVPLAATVMAGAPPPETGISPLYASAKVGENCTKMIPEGAPICGMLIVFKNGPDADVEKV